MDDGFASLMDDGKNQETETQRASSIIHHPSGRSPNPSPSVGRYAPSPTGAMHLGNARTALLAWLHTRAQNGHHILRFEDLDTGRVRDWAYDCTRRDLDWLGLDWDAEYLQSARLPMYAEALARLDTYPCTCTRKEVLAAIAESAGAPHGAEPIYPGTCRPGMGRPGTVNPGRPTARRWHVPDWDVCFGDLATGQTVCQNLPRDVGDFVLQRGDGVFAYHLAVVVDDADMGVTDIVRGVDLLDATPRQLALQRALGYQALDYPTPRYFHVPLMTDYAGQRLAKRGGAPPLRDLRENGEQPGRVLSHLARSLAHLPDWDIFADLPAETSAAELLEMWRQRPPFPAKRKPP